MNKGFKFIVFILFVVFIIPAISCGMIVRSFKEGFYVGYPSIDDLCAWF